jgi:1-acyl-sn-glycerol-3-phosphate acyltransferase
MSTDLTSRDAASHMADPFDAFGFDTRYFDRWIRVCALCYRWLRVRVDGLDNVPASGPALLVGNHAGLRSHEALSLQYAVRRLHPARRPLRGLMYNGMEKFVLAGHVATQYGGGVIAHPHNAAYLLNRGELVLVYPEGSKSLTKTFSQRHLLCPPHRFGTGFIRVAAETDTPIIPVTAMGFETTIPTLYHSRLLGRLWKMPDGVLPVAPQTFIAGSHPMWVALLPLPVRCRLSIGKPLGVRELGVADPLDAASVTSAALLVRRQLQRRLTAMVAEERSRSLLWRTLEHIARRPSSDRDSPRSYHGRRYS